MVYEPNNKSVSSNDDDASIYNDGLGSDSDDDNNSIGSIGSIGSDNSEFDITFNQFKNAAESRPSTANRLNYIRQQQKKSQSPRVPTSIGPRPSAYSSPRVPKKNSPDKGRGSVNPTQNTLDKRRGSVKPNTQVDPQNQYKYKFVDDRESAITFVTDGTSYTLFGLYYLEDQPDSAQIHYLAAREPDITFGSIQKRTDNYTEEDLDFIQNWINENSNHLKESKSLIDFIQFALFSEPTKKTFENLKVWNQYLKNGDATKTPPLKYGNATTGGLSILPTMREKPFDDIFTKDIFEIMLVIATNQISTDYCPDGKIDKINIDAIKTSSIDFYVKIVEKLNKIVKECSPKSPTDLHTREPKHVWGGSNGIKYNVTFCDEIQDSLQAEKIAIGIGSGQESQVDVTHVFFLAFSDSVKDSIDVKFVQTIEQIKQKAESELTTGDLFEEPVQLEPIQIKSDTTESSIKIAHDLREAKNPSLSYPLFEIFNLQKELKTDPPEKVDLSELPGKFIKDPSETLTFAKRQIALKDALLQLFLKENQIYNMDESFDTNYAKMTNVETNHEHKKNPYFKNYENGSNKQKGIYNEILGIFKTIEEQNAAYNDIMQLSDGKKLSAEQITLMKELFNSLKKNVELLQEAKFEHISFASTTTTKKNKVIGSKTIRRRDKRNGVTSTL